MPALNRAGRMLRWSALPLAAAVALALGSSPADAHGKKKHHGKHWGGHEYYQPWGHSYWQPRVYYPRPRYYYYSPGPTYYYPPPAYYYPRERYHEPRFQIILPLDID